MSSSPPKPLALWAYALPAIPIAALGQPFYMFAPTFYTREVGLSAGFVAIVLLAVRLVDAGADLAVGRLSDATRSRFGRRRPWVLLGAPLAALSAWCVLNPPADAGIAWFAVWTLAVSVAWAAIVLPLNAWGAELDTDYAGRTRVTAWREAATIAGVLVAVVAVALMSRQSDGTLGPALGWLGAFVAVTTPFACAVAVWRLPDPVPERAAPPDPLVPALRAAFANAPFRRLVAAYVVNGVANALPATLFIYFVAERLGRADLQGPLLLAYFVAGLISAPVWAWAGSRIGKHAAWCAAMVWAVGVFALALLVNGPEDWVLFLAVCVGSGLALGADVILPAAMQADVVDLDELASGRAPRTGLYFALWSMATKLGLALAAVIAFGGLHLAGFDTTADPRPQSAAAMAILVALYCVVPILLKLVAIAMMAGFPVTAQRQREIRAEIEARRANG